MRAFLAALAAAIVFTIILRLRYHVLLADGLGLAAALFGLYLIAHTIIHAIR